MNFSFVIPLSAAIVLFTLVGLILRAFLKTKLITFIYLAVVPLGFGLWTVNRTIAAVMPFEIDLFQISNLSYIIAPLFLIYFFDLIAKGTFTWKCSFFSFYGGSLAVGAIFVDKYDVEVVPGVGSIQKELFQPYFYMVLYLYILLIIILFARHLYLAYKKNKGESKKKLKQINIVFLTSILGIFTVNALRTLRLIDYPYICNVDVLFLVLGFGTLSWWYLKYAYLFHLDLIDVQLIGLVVFDNNGPLLYSYEFQSGVKSDRDLFVGALSGIDALFKEVLSSGEHLTEVKQESNIILLESGKGITLGLITNVSTLMTRNWLLQFRISFEKDFKTELEKYFDTGLVDFDDRPDTLVRKIFLHQ